MNKLLSHTIAAIISFALGMFLDPIRKWFNSEFSEQCSYKRPIPSGIVDVHTVIIQKRLGRNISVNCPWFSKRETKICNGKEYKYCPFGKDGVPVNGRIKLYQ